MNNSNAPNGNKDNSGFAYFALKRMIMVILLAIGGLWLILFIFGLIDKNPSFNATEQYSKPLPSRIAGNSEAEADLNQTTSQMESYKKELHIEEVLPAEDKQKPDTQADKREDEKALHTSKETKDSQEEEPSVHGPLQQNGTTQEKGVAFVEALIEPLSYELNDRWWGWRPNDIINITDNVNNEQLGVLEFTRRTSIVLLERMSRTGATASFDENLQQAMNWFMIKADQYWLPSPESKYKEGLDNLKKYKEKLENGQTDFYTRNDNLIPLLSVYEDLLGGCEENLVIQVDENGDPISFFVADDYFFYAKGVARAMLPVLEAISVEFATTIEARRGTDVIHHAIDALHHAVEIEPFIITNSDLDGILANHRANMAAPISHARFYLGVLIKTLST